MSGTDGRLDDDVQDGLERTTPLPPADPRLTGEPKCQKCGDGDCEWRLDPYAAEINDEFIYGWWCESCRQDRIDDI